MDYADNYIELTSSLISTHVTAVQIIEKNDLILVGEGSFLHAYHYSNGKHISTVQVFQASVVHGIRCVESLPFLKLEGRKVLALIYGQKSVGVISFDYDNFSWQHISNEFILSDWIIDAQWEPITGNIIIATSHNQILHINSKQLIVEYECTKDASKENNSFIIPSSSITSSAECNEKCLLYSGCLVVKTCYNDCVLLAGTIFSKLIIWGPWGETDGLRCIVPLHALSGHEGVLFSVSYSPSLNLITTTSDDRSMIVWDIQLQDSLREKQTVQPLNQSSCPQVCTTPTHSIALRNNQIYWKSSKIQKKLSCYGHNARVWRSAILSDCIISVGEDSKVCVWSLNGELRNQWKGHYGASIWCLSVHDGDCVIVTGGMDGSVKLWTVKDMTSKVKSFHSLPWIENLQDKKTTKNCMKVESDCDLGEPSSPPTNNNQDDIIDKGIKKVNKVDFPRHVTILKNKYLLLVTNNGNIWSYDLVETEWKLVFHDELFKNYCLLQISPSSEYIAFGTLSGSITILKIGEGCILTKLFNKLMHPGKVFSLNWISEEKILSCHENGVLIPSCLNESLKDLHAYREQILPSSRQRWVTTAHAWSSTNQLVVGDKTGSLYLYSHKETNPVDKKKKLHGHNGVTSIIIHKGIMLTAGRDGKVRWISVQDDQLQIIKESRIGDGCWLAGLQVWANQIFLLSFHGIYLQLWKLEDEQKILEIKCGGGHRSWDVALKSIVNDHLHQEMIFAFLKDGQPYYSITNISENILPVLKPSFNTQETLCLKPILTKERKDLFLTGCEDTTLKLHRIESKDIRKCVQCVRTHLSGIKCIFHIKSSDSQDNDNQSWLVTAGGRAQLKVWNIKSKECSECPLKASCCSCDSTVECNEVASYMLRGEKKKLWNSQQLFFDPETRFMDGTGYWISDDLALLILASSDGFVRFVIFNKDASSVTFLYSYEIGCCILRVCLSLVHNDVIVLLTTTSGKIFIYSIQTIISHLLNAKNIEDTAEELTSQDILKLYVEIPAHQSGINGFAVNHSTNISCEDAAFDCITIASGGDDNKVAITRISFKSNQTDLDATVKSLVSINGHASQIMGIKWLSDTILVSVSIDQRVCIWKLNEAAGPRDVTSLDCIKCRFTSIPDIHGLEIVKLCNNQYKLFIFGIGVQIFNLKLNH